ncbi:MAG: GlsB/YeaQ/YmgE family stress response membrane protein [Oligoflexia bacterium]|nr:GlsB/YeaQ/YmgE family stress response membrane protein [Oligoflexia bacterium]
MSVLGWILFGFVVGLIARAIMPGRDPLGLIGTTALGIVGALGAGWLGKALGLYEANEGAGFVAATLGAVIVLAIYNMIASRRRLRGGVTSSEDRRRAA